MNNPFALIIEDDEDLSLIFSEALTAAQFETEVIQDGGSAVARLAETTPDVVVLDLHLPNISGKTQRRENEKTNWATKKTTYN